MRRSKNVLRYFRAYYQDAKDRYKKKKTARDHIEDNTIRIDLSLSFEEAAFGVQKEINFKR